jgi:hypothetical protein
MVTCKKTTNVRNLDIICKHSRVRVVVISLHYKFYQISSNFTTILSFIICKHSRVRVVVMCVRSEEVQSHQHGDLYTFFKKDLFYHLRSLETNFRPISFKV